MEEIILLDAVERYLNGEMNPQEKSYFEELRSKDPEVDQMVVEHHLFLDQVNHYGERKQMKLQLNNIHNQLLENGEITNGAPVVSINKGATIIRLWNKHKRTVAVAASIAGITALTISGMMSYFSPKQAHTDLTLLGKVNDIQIKQIKTDEKLENVTKELQNTKSDVPKIPEKGIENGGGTSFLIDAKGYLVTNSHVINGASTLVVANSGKKYYAKSVYNDVITDIAILKIEDFTPLASLPYSIRKTNVDLAEQIFTLGYPRNEIVYDEGYLSAQSGYHDDTLSVQISVAANPGNSGGPVLDKNGDVIGILNSRENNANGVVFANKAANIYKALSILKESDTTYRSIKLPVNNNLKGKERTKQVDQLKACVFMVIGYK